MPEDARPPWGRDHAPTQEPANPSAARSPGAAWWTRPLPAVEAEAADVRGGRSPAGWYAPEDPGHPAARPSASDSPTLTGYPERAPRQGPGAAPGTATRAGDPRGGPGADPPAARRSLRQAPGADGRRRALTILGVLGGAPLLAALAVVALLPDGPTAPTVTAAIPTRPAETAVSRASRETTVPPSPSPTPTRAPGEPADLAPVATDLAAGELRRAGVKVEGTISSAWGWTDGRGRSLVVSIAEVTSQADDGSTTGIGLRVYYLTGLDGRPTVQRRLKDPSLRCSDSGAVVAGFTPAAFGVRDLDGDGLPEVTVGWTARCAAPGAASRARLAVMAGDELYVLRGTGMVTGRATRTVDPAATGPDAGPGPGPGATDSWTDPGGDGRQGSDGNEPAPVPAASQWPGPLLQSALATFHDVYF